MASNKSTSVTKADLVSAIAAETGLKKADAERAIAAMTTAIQAALTEGKKVTIVGFGTFNVTTRKARKGRNPKTRNPMSIPESRAVRFKAGKSMKDAVNP